MARALIGRGHEVTMLCGSHQAGATGLDSPFSQGIRRGRVDDIDVVEVQMSYSNAMGVAARAMEFIRFARRSLDVAQSEPYDLLFATSAPLTAAIPGIWMRKVKRDRRPFVFEIRDPWPEGPRAMGMKNPIALQGMEILESLAYRAACGWVALSPGMIESFARKGVPKEKVAMVPNGADLDVFSPSGDKGLAIDGIEAGDVVFAFPGAHGIANGLMQVVDACAELENRGVKGIKAWLVGDGKVKPALVARAGELGLKNIVFSDPMPKSQLARMLPRADAGLMILDDIPVFRYGSSPNKFFDFISAGLPVVVNHPGWVADMVRENDCGLEASPRGGASLADAMQAMAARSDRQEMGQRGRALAERDFDRARLAARLTDYLEQVQREQVVSK